MNKYNKELLGNLKEEYPNTIFNRFNPSQVHTGILEIVDDNGNLIEVITNQSLIGLRLFYLEQLFGINPVEENHYYLDRVKETGNNAKYKYIDAPIVPSDNDSNKMERKLQYIMFGKGGTNSPENPHIVGNYESDLYDGIPIISYSKNNEEINKDDINKNYRCRKVIIHKQKTIINYYAKKIDNNAIKLELRMLNNPLNGKSITELFSDSTENPNNKIHKYSIIDANDNSNSLTNSIINNPLSSQIQDNSNNNMETKLLVPAVKVNISIKEHEINSYNKILYNDISNSKISELMLCLGSEIENGIDISGSNNGSNNKNNEVYKLEGAIKMTFSPYYLNRPQSKYDENYYCMT